MNMFHYCVVCMHAWATEMAAVVFPVMSVYISPLIYDMLQIKSCQAEITGFVIFVVLGYIIHAHAWSIVFQEQTAIAVNTQVFINQCAQQ